MGQFLANVVIMSAVTVTTVVSDSPIDVSEFPVEEERTPLPLLALITGILIGCFILFIVLTRKPRVPRREGQPRGAPHPRSDSWWNP